MAAVYTGETTVLSVGGHDLLGVFKDWEIFFETETQDARYAKQDWKDPVGRISSWGLNTNTIVDSAEGIALVALLAGAPVAIIFEDRAVSGLHVEGNALLTRFGRSGPDSDGLANAIVLAGKGEPAITAST
jgi:hypothetical protein